MLYRKTNFIYFMKHDVYICYSSKDEDFAVKLYNELERNSVKCWYAPESIDMGKKWGGEIMRALENCKTLLFILSKSSNESDQVLTELETAKELKIPIIPVKMEDVDLSYDIKYFIRSHQCFEAQNVDFKTAASKIIKSLKGHLNIPQKPTNKQGDGKEAIIGEKETVKTSKDSGGEGNDNSEAETNDKKKYLEQNLAIETAGGVATALAEKGSVLPFELKEIFSTAVDNQPSVEVNLLYGNSEKASECKSFGRFHFDDIPPAKKGIPQIEITINIENDGQVFVQAEDLGTGEKKHSKMGSVSIVDKSSKPESLITSCTKCGAKARIKNGIPSGKSIKVKCPKCSHQYKVTNSIFGVFTSEL